MNTTTAPNAPLARGGDPNIEDATEVAKLSETRGPIRLGFWVLVVGFGLFLAWAAWAPLDEGVSAPAVVSVEGRRKTIQHMQGGVVRKVLVRDGAEVKENDVVIELDDAGARAGYQAIKQNYLSQRALEGRLMAELTNAASITFHPDLLAEKDPVSVQHMAVQQALFNARRGSRLADFAAAEQSITGMEGQVAGLRQMLQSRRAQQALQSQQSASVRTLAEEGFAPRNQALQLEQQQAEIRASLADLESSVDKLQSGIAEAKLRLAQRRGEYAREAANELANVRREVQANQERLAASDEELERLQIKSPVAGQVLGLAINGIGGVVQPGQHLMDILPNGESLQLEARIPPSVIDRVTVGDDVEVRFSAFAATPHLVVMGKLKSLSRDALTEQTATGMNSFYAGRVVLTPEGLKALGNRTVQPGMTAEVMVRTGERSYLTYMLSPFTKRIAAAMTEH